MPELTEVFLSLGSNVGDSRAHIAKAVDLLSKQLENLKQAPLYRSRAVHYDDQPDFLNTIVNGQTALSPGELLKAIVEIEQTVGRSKSFRWGPREIDIDIIFYGDRVVETELLTIPHFRFRSRGFVLQPLNDLSPDFIDPGSGQTVKELLDHFYLVAHSLATRVDQNS